MVTLKVRRVPIAGTAPWTDEPLFAAALKASRALQISARLKQAQGRSEEEQTEAGTAAMAEAVVLGVVLGDGSPAFPEYLERPRALADDLDQDCFLLLWEAVGDFNGMTKAAAEKLEKNSSSPPTGDSPTGSASPSASGTSTGSSTG